MKDLLPCSVCGNLPDLERPVFSFSLTDKHMHEHYLFSCNSCEQKYAHVDGAHFCTLPWHTYESAMDDWNSIVESKNCWYVNKIDFQLKLDL